MTAVTEVFGGSILQSYDKVLNFLVIYDSKGSIAPMDTILQGKGYVLLLAIKKCEK